MKPKSERAYAACNMKGKPPFIAVWSIRGSSDAVRLAVGEGWSAANPIMGWDCAKKDGWRVIPVKVSPER